MLALKTVHYCFSSSSSSYYVAKSYKQMGSYHGKAVWKRCVSSSALKDEEDDDERWTFSGSEFQAPEPGPEKSMHQHFSD